MTAFNTVLVAVGVDQSPADLAPPEGNVVAVPSGTEWPDTANNPVVPMVVKGTVGDGVNGGTSSNCIIDLVASDNFTAGVLTWNFIINIRGISTITVTDVPVNFSSGASQSVWTILAAAGVDSDEYVIYIVGSAILGISGATGMWIALLGHVRAAAWWLLATSPPASAYDVVTRQYGYIILCLMSVSMAIATIRRNSETSNNAGQVPCEVVTEDSRP